MLTLVNTCDWKYRKCRPLLITKSTPKLFTWDDVVSQRDKFGSAFLPYFSWESKIVVFFKLSRIYAYVSHPHAEKFYDFYWLQLRITDVQVRFFFYFEGKKRRHGVWSWTAWFIVKWFTVADFLDAQSNTTVYRFSQLDGGVCCQALWKRYLEELFH